MASQDLGNDMIDHFTDILQVFKTGENEVISDIPIRHKQYAQLIDKTYADNRDNFGDYIFKSSLKIDNTLYAPLLAVGFGGLAEYLLPKMLGKMINQRVGSVARDNVESGFLDYLIPMMRDEITDGNYMNNAGTLIPRPARGVGSRSGNVIDASPEFTYSRLTRIGRQEGTVMRTGSGGRIQSPSIDQVNTRDWFYKPNIPLGMLGVIPFAIMYQKALDSIKSNPESKIAPRMNYYQNGNDKIFTIRGTATIEDLAHDAILGGQISSGGWFKSPLLEKKLDAYEKFISENSDENDNIKIVGHSLGSLELSVLSERLGKRKNIEYVGYAQPVFAPHSNVDVAYSFDIDPLYNENNAPNHKILKKQFIKGRGDRFTQGHSTSNYF